VPPDDKEPLTPPPPDAPLVPPVVVDASDALVASSELEEQANAVPRSAASRLHAAPFGGCRNP
jgi:hypothetical protein